MIRNINPNRYDLMVVKMNIYGHFYILHHGIHYVTFVGIVVIGLYYLYRFRNLNAPILTRILFPGLYIFGAIIHYEIMWNSVWVLYCPGVVLDLVGFSLCEILVIYTVWLMRNHFKYNIPRIGLNRWMMVTIIMGFMMLWLYSTGFFSAYKLLYTGLTAADPHNFAWGVGKLVCLLSWLWIPESS